MEDKKEKIRRVKKICAVAGLSGMVFIAQNIQKSTQSHREKTSITNDMNEEAKYKVGDKVYSFVFDPVDENNAGTVLEILGNKGANGEMLYEVIESNGKMHRIVENLLTPDYMSFDEYFESQGITLSNEEPINLEFTAKGNDDTNEQFTEFAEFGEDSISDNVKDFLSIYEELANTLIYDEEYASKTKAEDREKGLSAYQARKNDIARTKKDKRGVCTTFSMRLSEELDECNIENYLMIINKPNLIHWVNVYKDNGTFYVADITEDIVMGNMVREMGLPMDTIPPISARIPLQEYLKDKPNSFIVDEIKDDGKPFEQLSIKPINNFLEEQYRNESKNSKHTRFNDTLESDDDCER